jgi:hypothetical protein
MLILWMFCLMFFLDFSLSLSAAAAAATLREQRSSQSHTQLQSNSNNEKGGGRKFMSLLAGLLQFGTRKATPSQTGPMNPVVIPEANVKILSLKRDEFGFLTN